MYYVNILWILCMYSVDILDILYVFCAYSVCIVCGVDLVFAMCWLCFCSVLLPPLHFIVWVLEGMCLPLVWLTLHPTSAIRNPLLELRVWNFDAHFNTISDRNWGCHPPKSRGASPPDLPCNIRDGFRIDFFRF